VKNKVFKKKDLVKNLSNKTGYPLDFSKKIIDDLIEVIINNIKSGQLNLKNIGSIKTVFKKERMGRNPKTKEEFKICSRKSISFLPSKKILNKLT
jgi:integration host factor subunit alpha